MSVSGIDFAFVSTIFRLDFGTVLTVLYFSIFHCILFSLIARDGLCYKKKYSKVQNDCLLFQYIYIIIVCSYERVTNNCAIYE